MPRAPEPNSCVPAQDCTQQEVNYGAQVPRWQELPPRGQVQPPNPPGSLQHYQLPFHTAADKPGESGSFAWGRRAGGGRARAQTHFLPQQQPLEHLLLCARPGLGTEHRVVSHGGKDRNLLEVVASLPTFPSLLTDIRRHAAQSILRMESQNCVSLYHQPLGRDPEDARRGAPSLGRPERKVTRKTELGAAATSPGPRPDPRAQRH